MAVIKIACALAGAGVGEGKRDSTWRRKGVQRMDPGSLLMLPLSDLTLPSTYFLLSKVRQIPDIVQSLGNLVLHPEAWAHYQSQSESNLVFAIYGKVYFPGQ